MSGAGMIAIHPYRDRHFSGVEALWAAVFPDDPEYNRAAVAVPAKLAVQPELFLVAEDDGRVVGTVMAGYDGHRGWLYAVAVLPEAQRRGVGTRLVREAEERLLALGCRKINLQVRVGNEAVAAFYERHGYCVEERVSMGKRFLD